jgi:hypothetical protein
LQELHLQLDHDRCRKPLGRYPSVPARMASDNIDLLGFAHQLRKGGAGRTAFLRNPDGNGRRSALLMPKVSFRGFNEGNNLTTNCRLLKASLTILGVRSASASVAQSAARIPASQCIAPLDVCIFAFSIHFFKSSSAFVDAAGQFPRVCQREMISAVLYSATEVRGS